MKVSALPTVKLPSGESVPQLGQGTWHMGESSRARKDEVAAVKLGLDLGRVHFFDPETGLALR